MTNEERRVYRIARKYGYEIHKGNRHLYYDGEEAKEIIRVGGSPTDEPEKGYQIHFISNGDCVAGIEAYLDAEGKRYYKDHTLTFADIEEFRYQH